MARLIHFKRFEDERGVLVPIEGERDIPFPVKRRWITKNVPQGKTRGNHAHKNTQQVIMAVQGVFRVQVAKMNEGKSWLDAVLESEGQPPPSLFSYYVLDRDDVGLYIEPGEWVSLSDFSPGAICEVLADTYYDEEDYIT